MNEVSVTNIHKYFGETHALNGCNFNASLGEIHAIVGENGSGKSTLAKTLTGVHQPDSGEVSILGRTPHNPFEAKQIGISTIFQEILVADEMSVTDNLFVGLDPLLGKATPKSKRNWQARELMHRLTGEEVDPDCLVGALPLSVKQWIVIGRALISKPKVLVFDESSAALDLDATNRLHLEMKKLRDSGVCIIIVTHRIAELVKITDRATVLRDGTTVGQLEKNEITEKNLLALMTAENRSIPDMPKATRLPIRNKVEEFVLEANKLQLLPNSGIFNFKISKGEIVGITGLDGQGQDRFLRTLAGIIPPYHGDVNVHVSSDEVGQVSNLLDADKLGVVYVSGDRKKEGIFPNLSIEENFSIALYDRNSSRSGWIARKPIAEAFKAEMRKFSTKMGSSSNLITSLSGGNQQKVLIGRALALSPNIIILNDPARGVDLATKRELYEQLRKFVADGGAVVYLSSELEEFFDFADRVDVFYQDSIFASLEDELISEEGILPAMFGHKDHIEFDTNSERVLA